MSKLLWSTTKRTFSNFRFSAYKFRFGFSGSSNLFKNTNRLFRGLTVRWSTSGQVLSRVGRWVISNLNSAVNPIKLIITAQSYFEWCWYLMVVSFWSRTNGPAPTNGPIWKINGLVCSWCSIGKNSLVWSVPGPDQRTSKFTTLEQLIIIIKCFPYLVNIY